MFETSVVRVQDRAVERRFGLLTFSVVAHAAIIIAIVAASLASVTMPNQAPNQITIPVFGSLPPALGTPDAKPAQPKPAQPAQPPQAQHVPVPQTVVAPTVVPETTDVAASTSTGSDDASSSSGDSGTVGVPWGSKDGIGIDAPPATNIVAEEQAGPLVAGVGDVKAPVVLRRVAPPYPRTAMMAHLNGFVIVECIIDRNGVVRDAKVVKSTSALFEQAALDAVQQWQFAPGSLHGKPVDTIFDLTVTFTITR
jgi:TonB family protein